MAMTPGLGERGTALSAGQRQRIGLARAVFGRPFLLVLDEPNANLDADGENALVSAIETLRDEQSIVIVISHRPNALAALNMTMVLYGGRSIAFRAARRCICACRAVQPLAARNCLGKEPEFRAWLRVPRHDLLFCSRPCAAGLRAHDVNVVEVSSSPQEAALDLGAAAASKIS